MQYLRPLLQSGYQALFVTLVFTLCIQQMFAQGMSSGSYRIESDSVNVGGGTSSSTNYGLESTTGEVATGEATSTSYALRAGYQQMNEVYLSLTAVADVTLLPALGGLTGGTGSGTTSFVVVTDNNAGYSVTFGSTQAPAMQGQLGTISNYVPAGAVPDYTFTTAVGQAHFGFTPEGVDITTRYQNSGVTCGVAGSDATAACWDGVSTTPQTIVSRSSSNQPDGSTTTLRFQVGVGASSNVIEGDYTATTTITALPL